MKAITRYTDFRAWLRALLKEWLHTATGTIMGGFGTNGLEQMAPEQILGVAVKAHLQGIGLTWQQCLAIFALTLFITTLRRVHEATAPDRTVAPFQS